MIKKENLKDKLWMNTFTYVFMGLVTLELENEKTECVYQAYCQCGCLTIYDVGERLQK